MQVLNQSNLYVIHRENERKIKKKSIFEEHLDTLTITFKSNTYRRIGIIILVYIPFLFQTPAQNYDKAQQAATYKISEKIKLANNVSQVFNM